MQRLIILALLVLLPASAPAQAQPAPMSREEIEKVVRDYLLREPQVIYDALQELQRRRDADEATRLQAVIAERRDDLIADRSDPVLGNPKGDVTLVEFFDYRCGYCRSMTAGLRSLLEQDKKLRFVMKELPVLGPESILASRAALAARKQGKYEAMHWALFQAKDLSEAGIMTLAREIGLDAAKLKADMASEDVENELRQTYQLAQALGINGTPSFVVGNTLIPGATPVAKLAELIDQERRK